MLEDKLDDPDAAGSFSGRLLHPRAGGDRGRQADRAPAAGPRSLPRWRGPLLRLFDLFPRLAPRLLPLVMSDARRRQRRYKTLIESGRWP